MVTTRLLCEWIPFPSGEFKRLTWTPSRAAAKEKVLGVPRSLATRLAFDAALGVAVWYWIGG